MTAMDFFSEYPRLEPAQQERFRQVITRLLSGAVLTPGEALRPDVDWRFAERHRELLDAYLRLGGWRLDIDLGLRLCRAVHESGEQRVRFNKLESLVLCTLRLVYHEQMQQAADEVRCEVRLGDLRERLIQSGRPVHQLQRRALVNALRRLERHSLVALGRGVTGEDTDRFHVHPLIEKVLPPDRIAELFERVRAYSSERTGPDGEAESHGEEESP
ncbi:DUF4194 domain-containing protein [Archangium sp.]|uniref:DUF4194 domain-containing protein n=1 Tax=Archangium sp. TaxID=1872627 RepID=UPI002D24F777|nr:DUF4194 domain-containing protein [Archangium sp.]HYO60159.1 DUF4194 domain-containing protein [Archangium sp.]